ncbi:MAG TPA: nitrilase-related carbon-nitrogen hydrolase [Syntrophomonas sp.]|nr:nitrilase-related carbon-nitrogen hydrolase [Syntrophomonas sp.]
MREDCMIAAVQMASAAGETQRNLDKILDISVQAAAAGAGFIVFPEMALPGYTHEGIDELALTMQDLAIKQLAGAAAELQVTLLVGWAEQSETGGKPYISQLIALPDGTTQTYRKVHLGRFERKWFEAGSNFPVFSNGGAGFAAGICWDWHFPEMAAIYSLKGAEILFAPHASLSISGNRLEIWQRYMQARAYDNSVYLVACNQCGEDQQNRSYSGGAMVWGPKGEILAMSQEQTDSILYAHLPAEPINQLRKQEKKSMRDSFFLANRKKELYHELLELDFDPDKANIDTK